MAITQNASDILNLIDGFLDEVGASATAQKTAADQGISFMDTPAATPANQSKSESLSTSQTNLGVEQQAEANAGNVNVDDTSMTNKDSDGNSPVDDQGPKTLSTDEPVATQGDIGPIRKQEITQEQKMANELNNTMRLGNGILNFFAKEAEEMEYEEEESEECPDCGSVTCECGEKEASEVLFDKLAHEMASQEATEYYHSFIAGMQKRAQDEYEAAQISLDKWASMGITPEMIQDNGGIPGLLSKIAMEDPGAVLPAEALPEAGLEGGAAPDEAAMLGDELAGAGVEEADLDESMAVIQELQDAGVAPEEIEVALEELAAEELAGEGEAPIVEEEKLASFNSNRGRIDVVKDHLRGGI
jgi:hypothetical protein